MFQPYTHTDGRVLLLGKGSPVGDERRLMFARYLPAGIEPKGANDWTKGQTSFGMMLNNALGDCTCAGVGHSPQIWTLNVYGTMCTILDANVEHIYEKWCGYVPGDPSTDQGGVEPVVLNKWRANGFFGHDLLAYCDPDPQNQEHVEIAVDLFGVVYIGLGLPITAQSQVGGVWDVVGDPNTDPNSAPYSWGGHCVIIVGYDADGLTCITWGALQKMTWRFWDAYCDESHALLGRDWVEKNIAPSGFNYKQLLADQALVIN